MDAQVQAFNEHRPLLFGIAWRMLGNAADAEDIHKKPFSVGNEPLHQTSGRPRHF